MSTASGGTAELAAALAAQSRRIANVTTALASHTDMAQHLAATMVAPTMIGAHVERLNALSSSFTLPTGITDAIASLNEAARSIIDSPTGRASTFTYRHNRRARRVRWHGRTFADRLGRIRIAELDRVLALCDAGRDAIAEALDTENTPAVRAFLLTMLVVLDALDDDARAHRDDVMAVIVCDAEPPRIRSTHAPPPRVSCAHHRRHLAPVASDSEPPATVSAGALRPRSSFATGGHT